MTAKEYLKDNSGAFWFNGEEYLILKPSQIEQYHQAKSKEEAGERYKAAWDYLEGALCTGELDSDKAIRLAAFGKEDEG